MKVVLLGATRRGILFLERLVQLLPAAQLSVFGFPEEPWEPPFLEELRALTVTSGGQFLEGKQVGADRFRSFWESTAVDLMFAVSWRFMIPARVYNLPRLGTFVFHDSLLPEYRGFAPTVWSMINGEDHTGVTMFRIAEEVDAGDVVDQERVPIGPDETIHKIMERVTQTYLDLLERNLGRLVAGDVPLVAQDHSRATYTCKRLPQDNCINWKASSESIYNLIRAVSAPYPGAHTYRSGEMLRIWSAQRLPDLRRYVGRVAGRVVEVRPGQGSVVLTGDGGLLLTRVQLEGGQMQCAAEVLSSIGQTLGG